MGHRFVEYNGKMAAFSTIAESFITPFMELSEFDTWMRDRYGDKYEPLEDCINLYSMKEAIFELTLNRECEEALRELGKIGVSGEESLLLLQQYGCMHDEVEGDIRAESYFEVKRARDRTCSWKLAEDTVGKMDKF